MSYAIQSKKIDEEANTSGKAILGELVFQLRQFFSMVVKNNLNVQYFPFPKRSPSTA
jgi:hypothetical protein